MNLIDEEAWLEEMDHREVVQDLLEQRLYDYAVEDDLYCD